MQLRKKNRYLVTLNFWHLWLAVHAVIFKLLDFLEVYSPLGLLYITHFGLTNCHELYSIVNILKKDV